MPSKPLSRRKLKRAEILKDKSDRFKKITHCLPGFSLRFNSFIFPGAVWTEFFSVLYFLVVSQINIKLMITVTQRTTTKIHWMILLNIPFFRMRIGVFLHGTGTLKNADAGVKGFAFGFGFHVVELMPHVPE